MTKCYNYCPQIIFICINVYYPGNNIIYEGKFIMLQIKVIYFSTRWHARLRLVTELKLPFERKLKKGVAKIEKGDIINHVSVPW